MAHLTDVQRELYLDGKVTEDDRRWISEHLEACRQCARLLFEAVPAEYYCLGRPMPEPPPKQRKFRDGILQQLRSSTSSPRGGVVVISGDGRSERMVYAVLEAFLGEAAKEGRSVAVAGQTFCLADAPERGRAEVAVLLEAPTYPDLAEWTRTTPGCWNILCGYRHDWTRHRKSIDILVASNSFGDEFCRSKEALLEAWAAGPKWVRATLLLASISVDVPKRLLPAGKLPPPLVEVADLRHRPAGYVSVGSGCWLAREALRDSIAEISYTRDISEQAGRRSAWVEEILQALG